MEAIPDVSDRPVLPPLLEVYAPASVMAAPPAGTASAAEQAAGPPVTPQSAGPGPAAAEIAVSPSAAGKVAWPAMGVPSAKHQDGDRWRRFHGAVAERYRDRRRAAHAPCASSV